MKLITKSMMAVCLLGLGLEPAMAQTFGTGHKVGLEFRTDLQMNNSSLDSDEDINDDTKSTKFTFARNRMRFSGNLNEVTSYFVRLRFDRTFDGSGSIDNTGNGLNLMYLDRKITPELTFRVGKIGKKEGSWEADYSGMDVYQYSFLDSKRIGDAIGHSGAELSYKVAGQVLTVQLLNSDFPSSAGQKNQKNFAFNFGWNGDIANGMIKPIITGGTYPSTKQKTSTKDSAGKTVMTEVDAYNGTQFGAGARLTLAAGKDAKIELEAEVDNVTIGEFDTTTQTAGAAATKKTTPDYKVDEFIFLARYNAPMIKPFLKYSSGSETKDGEDMGTHTYTSGGIEFFPDKDGLKTYRVHAVYIQKTHDCDNGFSNLLSFACKDPVKDGKNTSDDQTETQVNLGISARFN